MTMSRMKSTAHLVTAMGQISSRRFKVHSAVPGLHLPCKRWSAFRISGRKEDVTYVTRPSVRKGIHYRHCDHRVPDDGEKTRRTRPASSKQDLPLFLDSVHVLVGDEG